MYLLNHNLKLITLIYCIQNYKSSGNKIKVINLTLFTIASVA